VAVTPNFSGHRSVCPDVAAEGGGQRARPPHVDAW
jgi:hypothetical protein